MKLLCINDKLIKMKGTLCTGGNLVEGNEYETKGKMYLNEDNIKCYYIVGLGARLACRFTELLDEKSETEVSAEKAIEKIKREFELN